MSITVHVQHLGVFEALGERTRVVMCVIWDRVVILSDVAFRGMVQLVVFGMRGPYIRVTLFQVIDSELYVYVIRFSCFT